MNAFNALVNDMDSVIFDVLGGTPCTYIDTQGAEYETSVIIDKNVEIASAYDTQMPARRNVASLLKAEVPEPKRNHEIRLEDGETFTVDQLESDDGHILRVLLT